MHAISQTLKEVVQPLADLLIYEGFEKRILEILSSKDSMFSESFKEQFYSFCLNAPGYDEKDRFISILEEMASDMATQKYRPECMSAFKRAATNILEQAKPLSATAKISLAMDVIEDNASIYARLPKEADAIYVSLIADLVMPLLLGVYQTFTREVAKCKLGERSEELKGEADSSVQRAMMMMRGLVSEREVGVRCN